MKLTRNKLKEIIRQTIDELKEGGPGSGRPKGSGNYPGSSAGDKAFKKHFSRPTKDDYITDPLPDRSKKKKKTDEGGKGSGPQKGGGDSTGGPSYANIPKGAKTSKQAKKMLKKKKEEVKESKGRKCTVKEIKQWFKSLEENRYKKTYNSDARRVSWMVNNSLSEDYDSMPISHILCYSICFYHLFSS